MGERFLFIIVALALGACTPVQRQVAPTFESVNDQPQVAGPGDAVLDLKITKSLPNAFGYASLLGRTTDAGRVIVQFIGGQGKTAQFVRQNTTIETNETTLTRAPRIIQSFGTTNVSVSGNGGYASGTANSQSFTVLPGQRPQGYVSNNTPVQFTLDEGQSVTIEGRALKVLKVEKNSIQYVIIGNENG